MAFHRLALSTLLVVATTTCTEAFSPSGLPSSRTSVLRMVATTPADLGMGVDVKPGSNGGQNDDDKGAMMDLTGIVFSVSSVVQ